MNDALAEVPRRYALSFTTGGLLAREAMLLAPAYVEKHDWERVRALGVRDNLLQARTHTAGVRLVRETVQRLAVLDDPEVDLLVEATVSERVSLLWAPGAFIHISGSPAPCRANGVSRLPHEAEQLPSATWHCGNVIRTGAGKVADITAMSRSMR